MQIKAVIEIPKDSQYKYEINKESNTLSLDRVLNQRIPENYGFIINTLAPDGDALDVFIASNSPLQPLSEVQVRVIGAFRCTDNGVSDDKLIAVLEDNQDISVKIHKIEQYLRTYKTDFKVLGFVGLSEAVDIYMGVRT